MSTGGRPRLAVPCFVGPLLLPGGQGEPTTHFAAFLGEGESVDLDFVVHRQRTQVACALPRIAAARRAPCLSALTLTVLVVRFHSRPRVGVP